MNRRHNNSDTNFIECRGITTHNLKNISLDLPKYKWIAVTGVSGSGKTSLVFNTIASEAKKRFIETLGTFERQFVEQTSFASFAAIDNLPPCISLKQDNRNSDPRTLIASAIDVIIPIRQLFFSLMQPSCAVCGDTASIKTKDDFCSEVNKLITIKDNYQIIFGVKLQINTQELISQLKTSISLGYTKVISNNELLEIENLISNINSYTNKSGFYLVLDRIPVETQDNNLDVRLLSVWNQVQYSQNYSEISIFTGATFITKQMDFAARPFCNHCNKHTDLIKNTDLDWQTTLGCCQTCHGFGYIQVIDENKVIPDKRKSLKNGAIKPWSNETYQHLSEDLFQTLQAMNVDVDASYESLSSDIKVWLLTGKSDNLFLSKVTSLHSFFSRLEKERYKITARLLLARYRANVTCPTCSGTRLSIIGQKANVDGTTFNDLMNKESTEVLTWLCKQENKIANSPLYQIVLVIITEIKDKLNLLIDLGLGSCSLWRKCRTLSGGEYQRVLLARVIGTGLTDALYVLDEPSIGLGESELPSLISIIKKLRDKGNTILMVEHSPNLIQAADLFFELGPRGGADGGYLLPNSSKNIPESSVIPSEFKLRNPAKSSFQKHLLLNNFSALHCKNLSISLPEGAVTVITGASGAGKSTLINWGLMPALKYAEKKIFQNNIPNIDESVGTWENIQLSDNFFAKNSVVALEQKALGKTNTSIVATILDIMGNLRNNFVTEHSARLDKLTIGDFSFNSLGKCKICEGRGKVSEDLFFLGEYDKICPACAGKRFDNRILKHKWLGKNIAEWLDLTIDQTVILLKTNNVSYKSLLIAQKLGLGYLPLGLASTSFSGGEAQRLKMASLLSDSEKKLFCLFDEPTRGLSEKDIADLLKVIHELASLGNTFVVVEHHHLFTKTADKLIVMGPGGGARGGKIIQESMLQ